MLLSSLLSLSLAVASVSSHSLLEDGSHCVAYRAFKTMFLVSSDEVVGKNCDISAQVLPEVGGVYHIEVTIPIKSFDSGNSMRDKDVAAKLQVNLKSDLMFRSKGFSSDAWRELFLKGEFELPGEISVGAKFYPVNVKALHLAQNAGAEVDGVATVKFTDFGISPPAVGGGVIAKAKPEFELHFHLLGSRVLGADAIRLEKK